MLTVDFSWAKWNVVEIVAARASKNIAEPSLSTTRLQIIQCKILKNTCFQQISITS
jgi:hypothetical protein